MPAWLAGGQAAQAQAVPNPGENIQFLITFGPKADPAWGDDDFTQTFFFLVPQGQRQPVYLRVFDPDCGGTLDSDKGAFDTKPLLASTVGRARTRAMAPATHALPSSLNP